MQEAGLPDGVINLVHGSGATIGGAALASPELAGIHFTGSTDVFNGMWKTVGTNVGLVPQLPAHRRRDGRQGLHPRAPVRRRGGGRDRGRSRIVRVPGPEVLGGLPPVRPLEPVARGEGAAGRGRGDDQDGRRRRLRELHGRRHRRERVQDALARRSRRLARRARRSSPEARPTTPRATSSRRPSSRPRTRASASSATSSSARS